MIDTLWSEWAETQVLIATGQRTPTDETFTLDNPTYGQLDVGRLGSPLAPFVDVTCDVRALDWTFGATRDDGPLTRWEAASAVVILDNNAGAYDVGDPDSALFPMVPVQINARLTGSTTWLAMFTGYCNAFVVGFDPNTLDCTTTVNATDGTALLSRYEAQPLGAVVGVGELASNRVARILDNAEWTGPRDLQAGGRPMLGTDLGGDAWSQLVAVSDAELGAVYIAPNGAATFRTRETLFGGLSNTTVVATFGPDAGQLRYEDATIAEDDTLLRNIVDAQVSGGALQTDRDDASVAVYQPHRYGNTNLELANDSEAAAWASLIVNTLGVPFARVDSVTVMPRTDPTNLFPVVLNTKFLDRWHVKVSPPGNVNTDVESAVVVRGWHVSVDREDWTVTYTTSSVTGNTPFILDAPATMLDVVVLTA